ncbi:hypothetical protein RchiOBHm_Chr5g0020431 [Rosa chinensis]|uniref:Uncharacterized protein n=1 Tax=Rosa chinensis TaxID=74649 RepID=A0A2P6Q7A9_ROSCH|nr:hypothetical protein RchiOBHm_Chr5g0020431 [Rosa chinensis]
MSTVNSSALLSSYLYTTSSFSIIESFVLQMNLGLGWHPNLKRCGDNESPISLFQFRCLESLLKLHALPMFVTIIC